MKFGSGGLMERAIGSLLVLVAIAWAVRFIYDLLSPIIPVLVVVCVLVIVFRLVHEFWRRR